MNLQEFMKEIDGVWPQGMPPEKLDVVVVTEDQVILDIKGLTLQMINDGETVVIEFEPIDHSELKVDQLDQMAKYIEELRKRASTDKGRDSGSDAERVVASDAEEHEGDVDSTEDSSAESVASA
jgi:molybdenum cofactor biosynthesis enzyme MoaA